MDLNNISLRYRLLVRWHQVCLLAFWYDDTAVQRHTEAMERCISFGTLHHPNEAM